MSKIKDISFFIIIAITITFFGYILESDFLFNYLKDSIIGLLLTLLAINTATLGLIASKIQDMITIHPNFDFSETINEMKTSLKEQIILIALSIFTLLIFDSPLIVFELKTEIANGILTFILIYAISILWDTGKAVFIIIEQIQNMNQRNGNA